MTWVRTKYCNHQSPCSRLASHAVMRLGLAKRSVQLVQPESCPLVSMVSYRLSSLGLHVGVRFIKLKYMVAASSARCCCQSMQHISYANAAVLEQCPYHFCAPLLTFPPPDHPLEGINPVCPPFGLLHRLCPSALPTSLPRKTQVRAADAPDLIHPLL